MRLWIGLLVIGCLAVQAGFGQTPAQTEAYLRALRMLDAGQAIAAERELEQLTDPAVSFEVRTHAKLILGQLKGTFRHRLTRYEGAAHGDFVVIVPDEASAIAAMTQWTDELIYPVLIENAWWTPLFVRAYQPSQVYQWQQATEVTTDQALAQAIEQHNDSVDLTHTPPPGLVVIDPTRPQRTAGLALALAYGQPIWTDTSGHAHDRVMLEAEQANRLRAAVEKRLTSYGLINNSQWCGVTLACEWPRRYRLAELPKEVFSTDDLIGRDRSGNRLAVPGRLIGDAPEALYQAMSSLFLRPTHALVYDSYGHRGEGFDQYRMGTVAEGLSRFGKVTSVLGLTESSITKFRKVTRSTPYDMVWLTSSGMPTNFDVKGWGRAVDLPIGRASAWHVIHSFSAADPSRLTTVAGRLLAGGGYWYMGSMHEPYLQGFVTPNQAWSRSHRGTPLAMASRHLPGHPMSQPWKLTVIGDPLWVMRSSPARRVKDGVPEGAALYIVKHDHAAIDRLTYRWMWDLEIKVEPLGEAVSVADTLRADQLDLLAYLLYAQKDTAGLLDLPDDQLAENTLARNLVVEAMTLQAQKQLKQGQILPATKRVVRAAGLVEETYGHHMLLRKWHQAMTEAGQSQKADALLKAMAEAETTTLYAREAIKRVTQDLNR